VFCVQQSPDIERTSRSFGSVLVLLALTFLMNLAGVLVRAKSEHARDEPMDRLWTSDYSSEGPELLVRSGASLFHINVAIAPHRTTAFIARAGAARVRSCDA